MKRSDMVELLQGLKDKMLELVIKLYRQGVVSKDMLLFCEEKIRKPKKRKVAAKHR
jgi:hypothetical protein